jgi:hypothetical protein
MTLPFTNGANVRATGLFSETDITGANGYMYVINSTASGTLLSLTNTYPGATNARLQGQIIYEVA